MLSAFHFIPPTQKVPTAASCYKLKNEKGTEKIWVSAATIASHNTTVESGICIYCIVSYRIVYYIYIRNTV